jgi:hypothetical protein
MLILNFLFWGSYLPLSALTKSGVESHNPVHTQNLSIVLKSLIFKAKLDDFCAMIGEIYQNVSELADTRADSDILYQNVSLLTNLS